jgi:hypothetical protein
MLHFLPKNTLKKNYIHKNLLNMTQKTLILINKAKRLSKAVEIHLQHIKQQKLNEELVIKKQVNK